MLRLTESYHKHTDSAKASGVDTVPIQVEGGIVNGYVAPSAKVMVNQPLRNSAPKSYKKEE